MHEVGFILEAAGSVDEEGVDVAAFCGGESIKGDTGGVTAGFGFDNIDLEALCPKVELIDRACTESIGGGKEDFFSLGFKKVGELSNGGSFAASVDADDEKDKGMTGFRVGLGRSGENLVGKGAHLGEDIVRGGGRIFTKEGFKMGDELLRDGCSDVGFVKDLFELVEGRLILGRAEEGLEFFEKIEHSATPCEEIRVYHIRGLKARGCEPTRISS